MKIAFHFLLISLLLTTFCGLHAQEAEITPAEPELEQPEEIIGTLVLSDESALQVIDLLEQLTGKIILRRQDISPAKINFNSRGEITKREAVLALESLLTLNGIMLTDMGGRFMKAVPATDVNRHVPEMLMGSTLDLTPSQKIYAKLFRLDYLNAEQASGTMIQPLLSQNSSFVPFPKSNALLITDALLNLQRIENILAEADQPEPLREAVKFIKLNYIQAPEAQNQIENLIQGSLKSYLEGNTSVSSDERTNQLILVTHPGNVPIIMDVISNIDVDAAPLTGSEVFQLRQAKAEEVVPIIEGIISGQREGREKDAEVARDSERQNNRNNNANNNAGEAPNQPPASVNVNATTNSETNASLQFSNFVGLSADERTNSIVAYGTQQDLKTLKELIEKIDIPLPQVLIEAVISQVTLSETQASGLSSLSLTYDGTTRTFEDILMGTAGGISLGGENGATVPLNNPSDFVLSAAITPTNADSDTRVLSAPRIVVSHNEEGIINVSRSQPIITSSTSFSTSDNNVRSSVEYRDIGIQLTVTPLIGADGTVQMVIEQTIENVVETIEIDTNPQPIIGKREATSTISVKNGEIIVLGGLQENSESEGNNYFPLVGRLPIIKEILGAKNNDYDRSEVIIFIRPTILTNPAEANRLANEYIESIEETEKVKNYLENNTTGDSYLEGTTFEENKPPFRLRWPNF
ncbi:MAG TPA: secretin N-terminal domain-containing protein [Opitutales bacterium]|nr:secretin N-terminal domain-containing protein [Opitutales bacterium]